jgi:RNA polymerase sigma-70 factor, ECF subfamily
MTPDASFRDEKLRALPNLRAFARSLVHNPERADDLVQETILRAWSKANRFEP